MKKKKVFLVLFLFLCVTVIFAAKPAYYETAAIDKANGDIVIVCKLIGKPAFGDIVDVNGNVFVTLKNIEGVNKSDIKGLPVTLSKNLTVCVDDRAHYKMQILQADYAERHIPGIFEVGRALTRKMIPRLVAYDPDDKTLTDDRFYPAAGKYIAKGEFGNIRHVFRVATLTAQLTMVNQSTQTLKMCSFLKVKLVKQANKIGKNPLRQLKKQPKIGKWGIALQKMCLNKVPAERWSNELSDEGDIHVIYTSRDASAIQPYITHKQGLGFNVTSQQVSTGTDVQTTVQNAYNANPDIMYVQLVGDWADIKCAYASSKYPQDTELGLAAGSDNYLDLMVGRFSAESSTEVTTQVNKAIAYENNLPPTGFMVDGLGIGSPEGTGDDGEYDYQHIDNIKEYKLIPNQFNSVDECYQSYSSTCVQNSVNGGVGVINYCGHGSSSGWTSYSSTNVNALTNGSATPFIFSVACNVGDYDSTKCFAEYWLRKTNGGAVAALMSTYSQPWVPPMLGQDYFNDLLTGGYDYSSNPGSGTSTDHGKEILGSIVANGMILWIAESSTSSDVLTMKNWTLFGDVALRVVGEGAAPSPPVANFTGSPTSIMAGSSVNFTDTSTNNPTSWSWSFSGGTPSSSTAQNPTVTYNTPGTYTVSLTATNSAGSDGETKTNYITVTALQPPVANFTASATTITAGQSVSFTDTSTGNPTSWSWTFTGGTPSSSTAQNPSITYNTVGTYTVSLTAYNGAGNDTETKTNYITVQEQPIEYCTSQGNNYSYEWIAAVQVAGINNSSGAAGYTDFTSITGNLNEGDTISVSCTPGFSGSTYTEYWKIYVDYNIDGDFEDAGEEVFSAVGSSTVTGSFVVPSVANSQTRMRVSMKYNAAQTPCETFTYGEVEDYTVNLIPGTPLPPVAGFTASATTINVGQSVSFTDTSTNNPTSWSWSFEGGTPSGSTTQNPTVQYNTEGTYNVSLTATNSVGSDNENKVDYITVTAAPADDIAEAVDNATLTFTDSGNADWQKVTDVYYYDGDSAESGNISDNQSSTIETSVTVGTTQSVKFYWKVSSEANYDYLRFYIDGVEKTQIAGTVDWTQAAYNIGAGTHTLKWSFTKDGSVSSGSDCGWVDKVEIAAPAADPIAEAVDDTSLSFTLSGNGNWFSQTATTYYGGDAAQSADIGNSQTTTMETAITGKTSVKFYWKVSSESNYDYLRFYIDGVEQTRISGTVNWTQRTYSVSSGSHTLKWSFTKDGSVSSGSDCGWVDKVELQ